MSYQSLFTGKQYDDMKKFIKGNNEGTSDDGVQIIDGQLSVGTADSPNESVFGGGDSTPVEIAFHYDATTQVGLTIPTAIDITDALQSESGSTVAMFASNTAEQVIMIGGDTPPVGVKTKWSSLGNLEPDRVVGEYLRNDNVWSDSTYMVTGANFPYEKHSWRIASEINEQLRFALSIISPNVDFELKTLNINGVDYTKYWVRIRLTSPVTQVPELQQVKAHTNRTEINADGMVEFFGLARGIKTVEVIETANQASDPVNENVTYFTGGLNGGISKLIDNEFADGAVDSRMFLIKIEQEVDTSTPVVLSIPFYVKGANTGNIEFTIEAVQITSDFVYNSLVSPQISFNTIYPILTPSALERQILRVEVPIDQIDPTAGGVMVVVSRDARVGTNDNLADSIVLTGSTADVRRWRI